MAFGSVRYDMVVLIVVRWCHMISGEVNVGV